MQLDKNRARFEFAVSKVYRAFQSGDYDRAVSWSYIAGYLASNWHPGFYVHRGIETVLNTIGLEIGKSTSTYRLELPAWRGDGGRNWLHVLTTATKIGGHTRFAERWIREQTIGERDRHFVFVIDQGDVQFPDWLRKATEDSGGACIILPKSMTLIERALILRKTAKDLADTIVLNVQPHDPVPSLAFAVPDVPPVIFLNQADHLFWLGAGIADRIADIRVAGQHLTLSRRMKSCSTILPIPLIKKNVSLSKREYKKKIGVSESATILLSIGSSYKFKPYGRLNLPKVATDVLKRHRDTIFIVIGPSPNEPHWKQAATETGGRIKVLSAISDIDDLYGASDIYIESYPVGSLTATLDAVLFGTPVVRMPSPLLSILCIDQYPGMDGNAPDNDSYKDIITRYITDLDFRRMATERQKKAVEEMHTGEGWHKHLSNLEASLPLNHAFSFDSGTPVNAEISDAAWRESDSTWSNLQEIQHPSYESFMRILYYHHRNLLTKDLLICFKESIKDMLRMPIQKLRGV